MSRYRDLLQRPEWKAKSKAVKEAAGHRCQQCGAGGVLQVHHPKYVTGRKPWEYDDLIALCVSCHRAIHFSATGQSGQPADSLIGKYFYSFTDAGKTDQQGQVLGSCKDDYYLVQLFSWIDGGPTHCQLVYFSKMADWRFYPTTDLHQEDYRRLEQMGKTHR